MKSLLILLVLVNCIYISKAQTGTLDSSFGINGKVISETFKGRINGVAVQKDNKILIVGSGNYDDKGGFLIVRYNPDGNPDESFGNSGRVITTIAGAANEFLSVAVQSDGNIIASGYYSPSGSGSVDAVLIRYKSNGTLDSTFGNNGIVITNIARWDYPYDLTLQKDGKILIVGDKRINDNDNQTSFIARYNINGSLDEGFGINGIQLTTFNSLIKMRSIALTSDEKIIVGGTYGAGDAFILVSYLTNGAINPEFGNAGKATLSLSDGELDEIKIQVDGNILATGVERNNVIIARFTKSGGIDNTFSNDGFNDKVFESGFSDGKTILLQPDMKIIVAGNRSNNNGSFYTVCRFKLDGTLDSTFATNGIQLTSFDESTSTLVCNDAALQADGKIVLVGNLTEGFPPGIYAALARYNNDKGLGSNPQYVKIKHWLHHHGITWEDKPNNLINYYSIQSSTNGNAFTEVARIFNNQHGGTQTYTAANNATTNYRVAAVSNTGNIKYSNTLTLTATPAIQLYPNPAKNNLQIQGLPAGTTKLIVTDLSGNTSIIATTNSTVYSIHIAQLTSGNYLLHIKTANEVITKQFIKE
ncbi:T9SS type A sorting domain-containing protein [Limnovirga soli]|nr:T9SS type A sorting domain-containing protein [Limnovirga soli]